MISIIFIFFLGKENMVWPGLTKPIKLGLANRKDQEEFEREDQKRERRPRIGGLAPQKAKGWSGRSWPGKHVGQPQNEQGGLTSCSLLYCFEIEWNGIYSKENMRNFEICLGYCCRNLDLIASVTTNSEAPQGGGVGSLYP